MPYQNISQEITQAQYDAIVVKFNELKALLPFLINQNRTARPACLSN